jgi:hypothetical protein
VVERLQDEEPRLAVYLVEDLSRFSWWEYRLDEVRLDSLWIVEHGTSQGSALRLLKRHLASFSWYAMGTWAGTDAGQLRRFSERYPGLEAAGIAASQIEDPRGLRIRSEWCVVNSQSESFGAMFEAVRRSRGKGNCVAVAPGDHDVRHLFAVTSGLLWRAASGGLGGEEHGVVNAMAICSQINLLPRLGFFSVIPLDKHPWSGLALLGSPAQLSILLDRLKPSVEVKNSSEEVGWLYSAAGGLAL